MEIAGKHMGTSSVTRGLARHRMQADKGAKKASDKAGRPDMPEGEGAGSTHDHAGEAGPHDIIQQTTEEHGPATAAEVTSEGDSHTVKTTHEDGHEHTSKGHPSVAHVHEHLGHSIGAGGDEGEENEGDYDSGADGGAVEEMGLGGE